MAVVVHTAGRSPRGCDNYQKAGLASALSPYPAQRGRVLAGLAGVRTSGFGALPRFLQWNLSAFPHISYDHQTIWPDNFTPPPDAIKEE
jgi:hypothetical protein